MIYINQERAKNQCQQMYTDLKVIKEQYRLSDIEAIDTNTVGDAFIKLNDCIEAFIKLGNGL